MDFINHCRKYHRDMIVAIWNWAKRLEATECTIYPDGSVSLYCGNDCICQRYTPSARELFRMKRIDGE